MAKLTLDPDPTFQAPVPIHVPGKGPIDVTFTFRYRDTDEVKKLNKECAEKKPSDVDFILKLASGWELDEEFDKKNLAILFKKYPGAATLISAVYFAELIGARRKN